MSAILNNLVRNVRPWLARKEAVLLEVHGEYPRDGGQIRILVRMSGCTDVKVRATEGPERTGTTALPPVLQSTCGTHVSPDSALRISSLVQPACKITQNLAEHSQRRIPTMHAGEELDEHRNLHGSGAGLGTGPMLG